MKASDDFRSTPVSSATLAVRRVHVVGFLCLALTTGAHASVTSQSAQHGASATAVGNTYTFGAYKSQPPVFGPYTTPTATARHGKTEFETLLNKPVGKNFGQVPIGGGRSVPVTVKTPLSKPSAAAALGKFASRFNLPLTAAMGMAELLSDLNVSSTFDEATQRNKFSKQTDGFDANCPVLTAAEASGYATFMQYKRGTLPEDNSYSCSVSEVKRIIQPASGPERCEWGSSAGPCTMNSNGSSAGTRNADVWGYKDKLTTPNGTTVPVTETELADMIASQSGWPQSGNVAIAEAFDWDATQSVPSLSIAPDPLTGTPTVTGPATVPGPQPTVTTAPAAPNANGSPGTATTTTTTTTTNTYNNNTVNITNNTTSVTVTNYNDGTSSTSTTTTEAPAEPKPEEQKDPCVVNPEASACQKLDTPEETPVPKSDKNVTLDTTNELGEGACPAPVQVTTSKGSYSLSYQPACDLATNWLRPTLLAIAAIMAMFIAAGGIREA